MGARRRRREGPRAGRRGWALRAAAALAAGTLAAGCGASPERHVRPVSDATAMHVVDPGAVPGLTTVTRNEQDGRRHLYAAYPKIPGADALSEALARAEDERVRPFLDNLPAGAGRAGGAVPELNIKWSLAAASGSVVGVRLVASEFTGASAGESRRTLWYDGRTGLVRRSADLVDGDRGLRGLAEQVKRRLAGKGDPGRVTAEAAAYPSLAFNDGGDLVVEFSDYAVAPGSAGRVAVVLDRAAYEPLLSDFGRRARAAAQAPHPRLELDGTSGASGLAAVASTGAAHTATAPAPGGAPARTDCTRAKCVALTFDDGPGPYTARLLDDLAAAKARATFFVVGDNADVHADLLRREAAEGHEIGNHTQSHRDLSRLPAVKVNSDVQRTQQVVRGTVGRAPTLLRPPYGATDATVAGVARSLGLQQIMWSVDTEDWRDRDSEIVANRAVKHARPGAVILMHDIHRTTVDAVPDILRRLAGKGYTFVTVSDLLAGRNVPPGGRFGGE
ncbi:polysaccharide deacetylase family protein [Spirillospora sp. NPDC050679]